jgi:hypothetical protein
MHACLELDDILRLIFNAFPEEGRRAALVSLAQVNRTFCGEHHPSCESPSW